MRKRERQEKILSSTLAESLILFLFILLAITSIYKNKVNEFHQSFTEKNLLQPGHKSVPADKIILGVNEKAIDQNEYNHLVNKANQGNNELKILDKLKDALKNKDELLKDKDKTIKELKLQGVSAPPCILANDKQVLFDVEFLKGKIYRLTFKNLPDERYFGKWRIYNGLELKLDQSSFLEFASIVSNSNKINTEDDYCCCEQKKISSAYCTECVYVFHLKKGKKKRFYNKKGIGEDLALEMHKTVLRHFYSDQK